MTLYLDGENKVFFSNLNKYLKMVFRSVKQQVQKGEQHRDIAIRRAPVGAIEVLRKNRGTLYLFRCTCTAPHHGDATLVYERWTVSEDEAREVAAKLLVKGWKEFWDDPDNRRVYPENVTIEKFQILR